MTPRHPVRAAIGAAFVTAAVIAVFGNRWFFDHVVQRTHSDLTRQLLRIPSTFSWRFSAHGSTTIWVAQLVGAVVAVVFVFFLVWAVAKRASGLALLIGGWGATVLAAMLAGFVEVLITYGELFPRNIRDPQGFGRFWYAVFLGAQPAALFGVFVGVVAGLFAALLAGAVSQSVAPVLWQPAPAGGGYGGVSLSPVPVPGYGTDAPVDPTTPYVNPYPSAPAPASTAGPYPYTSEYETAPPPGHEQADPTVAMPVSPAANADGNVDVGDPTTVIPVVPVSSAVPVSSEHVEWAPPPPSAASPSWRRPEDPPGHD
ncbi:MAG: hypothetical protein ABIR68_00730 [Ilumatobacteraceae bacterium]